jgi:hypothetical protein
MTIPNDLSQAEIDAGKWLRAAVNFEDTCGGAGAGVSGGVGASEVMPRSASPPLPG